MTREDAMRLLQMNRIIGATAEMQFLSWAEGLGILKFDEPPLELRESPNYRAYVALSENLTDISFLDFRQLLTSADLQIVEKQGK